MKMNNIVMLGAYEPPDPRYGPHIQVVAYDQRKSFDAQSLTLVEKPTVGMGQKIVVMSALDKMGQETKNLSLATTPVPLRIDM